MLIAEQGLGDILQFIRFVPLIQQTAGRVILQCQPPLERLLTDCWSGRTRHGDLKVVAGQLLDRSFDVYAPLVSLPGVLGTSTTNIPADVPYFSADRQLASRWQRKLNKALETRNTGRDIRTSHSSVAPNPATVAPFRVGIAWQGTPTYRYDRQRSIPLKHFTPLAEVPEIQLISLQKGPGTEQLQALATTDHPPLVFPLDEAAGPFMDTAAIMQNLDLIICSDTVIVHLAGALGVPVWVALPAVPDWRWLLEREDSPWYPTLRLFRQNRTGDWTEVFQRLAKELARLVSSSKTDP
jgi:hypothetical protein